MKETGNRLVLLSPSLRADCGGHNYRYNLALAGAAREFSTLILADDRYQGPRPAFLIPAIRRPQFAPARRLWELWRSTTGGTAKGEPGRPGGLAASPPYRRSPAALFQRAALELGGARRYARALRRRLPQGAWVFIEDASLWEIAALERLADLPVRGWGLMLRLPPARLAAPFFMEPAGLAERLRRLPPRAALFADTGRLVAAYRKLTGRRIIFAPAPPLQTLPGPGPRTPGSPLRLGYMGPPRLGKGFGLLPWLHGHLPARLAGLETVLGIQLYPPSAETRGPARRLAALAARPDTARPRLELYGENEESYEKNFAGLDILLLLYTDYHYRFGSSGLFIEAAQVGRPVLTFAGSWAAGIIARAAREGLEIGRAIEKPQEAPAALAEMAGRLESLQRDMALFAARWLPGRTMRRTAMALAAWAGLAR